VKLELVEERAEPVLLGRQVNDGHAGEHGDGATEAEGEGSSGRAAWVREGRKTGSVESYGPQRHAAVDGR
jgi:hypothetical protein